MTRGCDECGSRRSYTDEDNLVVRCVGCGETVRELPANWQPLGVYEHDDPYTEDVNDIRQRLREGEFVTAGELYWYETGRWNAHA